MPAPLRMASSSTYLTAINFDITLDRVENLDIDWEWFLGFDVLEDAVEVFLD